MRNAVIIHFCWTVASTVIAAACFAQNAPASYGPSITLAEAKRVATAAEKRASQGQLHEAIAIMDSTGHLLLFIRSEDLQYASIEIAWRKAETALNFKRSTKVLNDALNSGGSGLSTLAFPGLMTPSEGGLPIVREGRIIGSIGVSGGTGAQDQEVAEAGLAALK